MAALLGEATSGRGEPSGDATARSEGPALGVAVSGGSDSTALLLAAARLVGVRVETATVDHRLRPEAAAEARSVAALCSRLGLRHETLAWRDGPQAAANPGNLAQAARDARARLLAEWARSRGLTAVALGHTQDDQAETLLLRLARGSGLDGLTAMRALSRREGVAWLRPALDLPREALRTWLRAEGVAWHDDPSNVDPAYDRPRARAALRSLAPLGLTAARLAETAARLAEDADHLAEGAAALIGRIASVDGAGALRLDRAALLSAPPPLRRRALARLLTRLADAPHPPRARALDALIEALTGADPVRRTLHGVLIDAVPNAVFLSREPERRAESVPVGALWDGRWRVETAGSCDETRLGALETTGMRALSRLEAEGVWTPSAAWKRSSRAARCVSPALWEGENLRAAPLAGHGNAAAFDAIAAHFGLGAAPPGHVGTR
ncbi:MAG: tRNA lysidine(34) synthetase TilS [Pseudomonadota bacterium]